MRVLVVNAGSRSLKVSLVGPDDKVLAEEDFEVSGGKVADSKLDEAIQQWEEVLRMDPRHRTAQLYLNLARAQAPGADGRAR